MLQQRSQYWTSNHPICCCTSAIWLVTAGVLLSERSSSTSFPNRSGRPCQRPQLPTTRPWLPRPTRLWKLSCLPIQERPLLQLWRLSPLAPGLLFLLGLMKSLPWPRTRGDRMIREDRMTPSYASFTRVTERRLSRANPPDVRCTTWWPRRGQLRLRETGGPAASCCGRHSVSFLFFINLHLRSQFPPPLSDRLRRR